MFNKLVEIFNCYSKQVNVWIVYCDIKCIPTPYIFNEITIDDICVNIYICNYSKLKYYKITNWKYY